jgi:hypothetical protein
MSALDIRYTLEIDEDGYPIFSGLRAEDDELLGEILRNLKRSDPARPSSRLLTTFDHGKKAWIEAFDDPLVVMSVEMQGEQIQLNFLGQYSVSVGLRQLEVDAFQRFHVFVGEEKIPAVFSRKAQAAL